MAIKQVKIPDLNGASDVDVVEILVSPGDSVEKESSLVTLEGDKASMDIPSPFAGTIEEIKIEIGDKVNEGDLILTMDVKNDDSYKDEQSHERQRKEKEAREENEQDTAKDEVKEKGSESIKEVKIPDLSGAKDVDVVEVLVNAGDKVQKEDSLVTLEGDKASMDVPSPFAGVVQEVKIKEGDKVNQGNLLLTMKVTESGDSTSKSKDDSDKKGAKATEKPAKSIAEDKASESKEISVNTHSEVHAGPAVRRIAREFGVDLEKVNSSGSKNRILKEDIQAYVKDKLSGKQAATTGIGLNLAPPPKIDFSKFGEVETKKLSKIKRLTGVHTHRSWVTVPHVTQFDEADITELEAFRKANKGRAEKQGFKLTPLVFIMKAIVQCLKQYPTFNSSLDDSGENIILKKYFHIGVAVDTPNGLVVAVVRDVDQKSLFELAKELGDISNKAREKGLTVNEMSGSCITISSLGGIGGTAFTPIVNAPDVAILGVSKSQIKPLFKDGEFQPRLMLPLSLSYDHRVIDGAEAARFTSLLSSLLGDIREILL